MGWNSFQFGDDPTFRPWRWRRYIPLKRRDIFELHGFTNQKTVIFLLFSVYKILFDPTFPVIYLRLHLRFANANNYTRILTKYKQTLETYMRKLKRREPVTEAERSKAWTVFALSEAGIMGSNPTQGMYVLFVYVFILCLCCPVFR
jgi:hypothetical protein